jgi:hypothetical protein
MGGVHEAASRAAVASTPDAWATLVSDRGSRKRERRH